jgi:hypothetical protein
MVASTTTSAVSSESSPVSNCEAMTNIDKSKRYDRGIRVWGAHGQVMRGRHNAAYSEPGTAAAKPECKQEVCKAECQTLRFAMQSTLISS